MSEQQVIPSLLTLQQFADRHLAFPVSTLRWLRFRSHIVRRRRGGQEEVLEANGFGPAFIEVCGRVLVDEDRFFEIVAEQNGGQSSDETKAADA